MSGRRIFLPDLARALGQTFSFQKYPQTLEDLDISKGIVFLSGKVGRMPVDKLAIWEGLITAETMASTTESAEVITEILNWALMEYQIDYTPDRISHYGYVNGVTFYSDAPLLQFSPALRNLSAKMSTALSDIWNESLHCETLGLRIGHDPTVRQFKIAGFTIERRGNTRFDENKYYSEAPLPTDLHLELLREFEDGVSSGG